MDLLVKPVTGILGLVLTLLGIAGFFVGGMLLFFEVGTVQNMVHFASGLIALFSYNSGQVYARLYLIIFGLVYGLVTIVGFTMGGDILGLFHVNTAGNYLHLAIAAVCLVVGFGSKK